MELQHVQRVLLPNDFKTLFIFVFLVLGLSICSSSQCSSNTSHSFINDFVYNISQSHSVSVLTLKQIFDRESSINMSSLNDFNCTGIQGVNSRTDCILKKCLSIHEILELYSIPEKGSLSSEEVLSIAPALLFLRTVCQNYTTPPGDGDHQRTRPNSAETWGYGFLFVTIINICSLSGAVVLPCMNKDFYQKVLIFMVSLAVGSLAGSGLLVLIPEALGLMHTEDHKISDTYIVKTATVGCGVYLFFLIERFLKIILKVRQSEHSDTTLNEGHQYYEVPSESQDEETLKHTPSIKRNTPVNASSRYKNMKTLNVDRLRTVKSESSFSSTRPLEDASINDISLGSLSFDALNEDGPSRVRNGDAKSDTTSEKKDVATVAWMIIFGDGLHNFIDGLTIGAAFTESILAGISICVAVFCEELPHELGDFAILLNSGMTVKKALLYNFLSACMCYIGLVLGILLGENTSAHDWVFALAGGMFLYISLVDMMPEMNSAAESEENKASIGSLGIFLLQNFGLICGFGVILIMALYGGEIDFEK